MLLSQVAASPLVAYKPQRPPPPDEPQVLTSDDDSGATSDDVEGEADGYALLLTVRGSPRRMPLSRFAGEPPIPGLGWGEGYMANVQVREGKDTTWDDWPQLLGVSTTDAQVFVWCGADTGGVAGDASALHDHATARWGLGPQAQGTGLHLAGKIHAWHIHPLPNPEPHCPPPSFALASAAQGPFAMLGVLSLGGPETLSSGVSASCPMPLWSLLLLLGAVASGGLVWATKHGAPHGYLRGVMMTVAFASALVSH